MQKKKEYGEARNTIEAIYEAAVSGKYEGREAFMAELDRYPHIAAQGYNQFGKIFFWNRASALLYGHREEEAVNRDLFELILPPDMRPFARDLVQTARRTGQMPAPGPCDLLRRDGSLVTVFSGHLVFQWKTASSPEFYCIDIAVDDDGR